MKNIIRRQIDNVCSIYSQYVKLGLLMLPRHMGEFNEFLQYEDEILSTDIVFNIQDHDIRHKKIKNILILDLDNVVLIYKFIVAKQINYNVYEINHYIIEYIKQFDAESLIVLIITNHSSEDIRPIFKRSVEILIDYLKEYNSYIISNIGEAVYNSKAYITTLFLCQIISLLDIDNNLKIYQYESEMAYLYGFKETIQLMSNVDINNPMITYLKQYYDIDINSLVNAVNCYSKTKLHYLDKNNVSYDNKKVFLEPEGTNIDEINHINEVVLNNSQNGFILFHFPCYLLLKCKA